MMYLEETSTVESSSNFFAYNSRLMQYRNISFLKYAQQITGLRGIYNAYKCWKSMNVLGKK